MAVPSGIITKQVGEKVYVLVGLKDKEAPRDDAYGEPFWLRWDTVETPMGETVPEGKRVSAAVNLPL
jgi:hypothetical protein